MTPQEALTLCRLAKAAYPQMSTDEYTPDAWALALDRERFDDAKEALRQLMREQEWLHVSDIVARVKKIRSTRIADYGPLPAPPPEIADDPRRYRKWHLDLVRRIGDGEDVPALQLVAGVEKPANIDFAGVFKSTDEV